MIHSKKLSVRTVWTVCCLHGLRFNMTVSAWTKTTWSTLNIENPTKTRPSGLSEKKPEVFYQRCFATGDNKCPVLIFREFL